MQTMISGCDGARTRLGHNHSAPADCCKRFDLNLFPPRLHIIDPLPSIKATIGACGCHTNATISPLQISPAGKIQIPLKTHWHSALLRIVGRRVTLIWSKRMRMDLSPIWATKLNMEMSAG